MTSPLTALLDLVIQLILVSFVVSTIAFASFGAYTLLSAYHTKLLELELIKSRSEFSRISAEKDAQVAALTAEVEGLRQRILEAVHQKEEVEARTVKREVGFLELEAKWARERDDLRTMLGEIALTSRHAAEILELKASTRSLEAACALKDTQIQTLTQAKEHIEIASKQHGDKILELTDKLSEYHRRLTGVGDLDAVLNSSAAKAKRRLAIRSLHRKHARHTVEARSTVSDGSMRWGSRLGRL